LRTLVVSDLHLGSRTEVDVLRRPAALEAFAAELREDPPERLVLLGDVLELRHGPVADALDAARPVFEAIGEALPPGTEVLLVPGNHDHALVAPWLERRALRREPPLGLAEHVGADATDVLAAIAAMLGPARLEVAYPGAWLRPDVYATHGHYLDRHLTVPRSERVAAGIMARVASRPTDEAAEPDDYEAVLDPIYAWLHLVARHTRTSFGARRQREAHNAWRALTTRGRRPLRLYAIGAAFPLGVRLLNALGVGPLHPDLSGAEIRRAGLRAMAEVCRRLELDADWVLFGHTHRAGPLDRDDPAAWRVRDAGPRMLNSGCWVHEKVFVGRDGRSSPYWPGYAIEVPESGPPRLRPMMLGWEPAAATPAPHPA
jgi:UDP-2,3-diacylglucosamine pyrophosphatase LpxH